MRRLLLDGTIPSKHEHKRGIGYGVIDTHPLGRGGGHGGRCHDSHDGGADSLGRRIRDSWLRREDHPEWFLRVPGPQRVVGWRVGSHSRPARLTKAALWFTGDASRPDG